MLKLVFAGLLMLLTFLSVGCFTVQIPVYNLSKPIRLSGREIDGLVLAVNGGRLRATAQLNGGSFQPSMLKKAIDRVTIEDGTRVTLDTQFKLTQAAPMEGVQSLSPDVKAFELRFSKPITIALPNLAPLKVSVIDAKAKEGKLHVSFDLGETLTKTIIALVLNLGGDDVPQADLKKLLSSASVAEAELDFKPDTKFAIEGSEISLRSGSTLKMQAGNIVVATNNFRFNFDVHLLLGTGTCFDTQTARVCTNDGDVALSGTYVRERGDIRTHVSGVNNFVRLGTGSAKVAGVNFDISSVVLAVEKYSCAFPVGRAECEIDANANMKLSAGVVDLNGYRTSFSALSIGDARYERSKSRSLVMLSRLRLENPALCARCDEKAHPEMKLEYLAIPAASGTDWSVLKFAQASVDAGPGTIDFPIGNVLVQSKLLASSELRLSAMNSGTQLGDLRAGANVGRRDVFGSFRAAAVEVTTSRKDVLLTVKDMMVDAELGDKRSQVSLRLGTKMGVALPKASFNSIDVGLSEASLATTEDGKVRVSIKGLSIEVQKDKLINELRKQVPTTYTEQSKALSNDGLKALVALANPTKIGRLDNFQYVSELRNIDRLGLSFQGQRINVAGRPHGSVNVTADEMHVSCKGKWGIPYPCTRKTRENVFYVGADVDVDVDAELTSNAPTKLSTFELSMNITNCRRIDIHGIHDRIEAIFRDETCGAVTKLGRTVRVIDWLGASAGVMKEATVEKFNLSGDSQSVRLDLGFDVVLPQ